MSGVALTIDGDSGARRHHSGREMTIHTDGNTQLNG